LKSLYNFGGSPTLRTQIEQGACTAVFVSADMAKMELPRKNGTVVERVEETHSGYVGRVTQQKRLMAELPRQAIDVIPRQDDAAAHAIPQPEALCTLITTEAEKL
jgi:hypothetical protein